MVARDSLRIMTFINEGLAGTLRPGQKASVVLRSRPGETFAAHIDRIEPASDRITEERSVSVVFDRAPDVLYLAEQAEVRIDLGTIAKAYLVPERAVRDRDGDGGIVWTVEKGRLAERRVEFGRRLEDGRLELISPIPDGMRIAAERLPAAKPGEAAMHPGAAPPVILAFRDLLLKYQRFLATSAGVGLLLGVVLIQAGIYRGIVADAFDLTEIFGTDMWVVQPDHFGPFTESSLIATATRDLIKRVPGVRSAEAITVSQGLANVGGVPTRVDVVGYDLYRMPFPGDLITGRAPTRPRYEVAVDRGVGAERGDRIIIRGRAFTVVGVTGRAVGISGNPIIFMSLPDARDFNEKQGAAEIRRLRATGVSPGVPDQVNAVRVVVQPGSDVGEVRREIEQWKHFQVISRPDQEANILRNIGRLRMTLLLFASILVLAATAIIALTIYSLTTDKVREIATLKLIGAGNPVITGLVLWQAIAIGVSGYLGGNLFLYSVRDFFPGYLELRVTDNIGIGVIAISACLIASIGAVRLALGIEPHQALGG